MINDNADIEGLEASLGHSQLHVIPKYNKTTWTHTTQNVMCEYFGEKRNIDSTRYSKS